MFYTKEARLTCLLLNVIPTEREREREREREKDAACWI